MADATNTKPAKTTTAMKKSPYPELPIGVTSFGGAIAGDHLYVFGGHCGDAHDYYKDGQNATLYRMNVRKPAAWESVNESTGLQGLAMVEHKGSLYRVGGFTARNEQGQEQDLHSVAEFARFNFESNQWDQLQPMPKPRSSLDAVVVGDTLFVVGGWMIDGKEKTVWADNMISFDLSDRNAEWQTISVPFKRRALSVGDQGDQLYVVGGMKETGGTTSEVEIYDIKSKSWRDGPTLPGGGEMEGFGSSSFNVGGQLVVSTYGGSILKLNDAGDSWQQIHQLENGRFFHRLLPLSSDQFVLVGGANMVTGKFLGVPVLDVR
jgi:N-acetylneuraminic acid mutarotase